MTGLSTSHCPIYGPGGEVGQNVGGSAAEFNRQVSLQLSPTTGQLHDRYDCISCYMYV